MGAIVLYALKVIAASAILLFYYYIALRNKSFHEWNRFYLLAVPVFSLIIPLFSIPVYTTQPAVVNIAELPVQFPLNVVVEPQPNNVNWSEIFSFAAMIMYCIACIVMLLKMAVTYRKISKLKVLSERVLLKENIFLYHTDSPYAPFSFFNNIFWRNEISLLSQEGEQILNHEMVHVREKHSVDKVFMQFIVCFAWINPFFWLVRKELEMVHEFIADKKCATSADVQVLANAILKTVYPSSTHSFTNNFFHSPIKRRLTMLMQKNKSAYAFVLKGLALPVLIIAFFISVGYSQKTNVENNADSSAWESGFEPGGTKSYEEVSKQLNDNTQKTFIFYDDKEISREQYFKLGKNDIGFQRVFKNPEIKERYNKKDADAIVVVYSIDREATRQQSFGLLPENCLYIVDGKEATREMGEKLLRGGNDGSKHFTMVGNAAVEKYGEKAKYGVLLIFTKKWMEANPEKFKKEENDWDDYVDKWLNEKQAKEEADPNTPLFNWGRLPLQYGKLYIVDGMPIPEAEAFYLTVDNIESMTVLKDKSAIAPYGEEGKNGVLIIYTKKWVQANPGKYNKGKTELQNPPIVAVEGNSKKDNAETSLKLPDGLLIIVDGKETSRADMKKINTDDMKSINILKDESAIKKYGEKGRQGVIEIETKK